MAFLAISKFRVILTLRAKYICYRFFQICDYVTFIGENRKIWNFQGHDRRYNFSL